MSKYNLEGLIEIVEDEQNAQLVIKKYNNSADMLD
jgi:hypothetical protein